MFHPSATKSRGWSEAIACRASVEAPLLLLFELLLLETLLELFETLLLLFELLLLETLLELFETLLLEPLEPLPPRMMLLELLERELILLELRLPEPRENEPRLWPDPDDGAGASEISDVGTPVFEIRGLLVEAPWQAARVTVSPPATTVRALPDRARRNPRRSSRPDSDGFPGPGASGCLSSDKKSAIDRMWLLGVWKSVRHDRSGFLPGKSRAGNIFSLAHGRGRRGQG